MLLVTSDPCVCAFSGYCILSHTLGSNSFKIQNETKTTKQNKLCPIYGLRELGKTPVRKHLKASDRKSGEAD